MSASPRCQKPQEEQKSNSNSFRNTVSPRQQPNFAGAAKFQCPNIARQNIHYNHERTQIQSTALQQKSFDDEYITPNQALNSTPISFTHAATSTTNCSLPVPITSHNAHASLSTQAYTNQRQNHQPFPKVSKLLANLRPSISACTALLLGQKISTKELNGKVAQENARCRVWLWRTRFKIWSKTGCN